MLAQYAYDVEVYRTHDTTKRSPRYDAWGNLIPQTEPQSNVPILYGRRYSHTIHGAVVAPRTTGIEKSSPVNAQSVSTGKTMYVDPGEDIHQDDYIKYVDEAGKVQVYKVEGEGDTNVFVSPYTNYAGGVEVHLMRVKDAV